MFEISPKIPIQFRVSAGCWVDVQSPNDGRHLVSVQNADQMDIDFLLSQIKDAQIVMRELDAQARSRILRKAAELLAQDAPRLAWIIAAEGGKPLRDARVEVGRAQTTLNLCAQECLKLNEKITIPMDITAAGKGHVAYTIREPIGPVLAISAFNHPLNLLAHQVGCAIASGCAVVAKPAPSTPLSAYELALIFKEAGLPEGILQVVNADIPQVETLVSSPVFSYVNFIGSQKVGWSLRQKIAPGTRLGLEHGGIAPAVVAKDADLDAAATALIKGSFYHAGQVCISTQRIFVHKDRFDEFHQKFRTLAAKLVTGSAENEDTDVGPLIRKTEVDRIRDWIKAALSEGASLSLGDETLGDGQYLKPTILLNASPTSRVMSEEIFGPVVCLSAYENIDELLEYLNESPYAFESCLFSNDASLCEKFAHTINSMTVVINNHNAFRVDWMPFGGHGLSGLGMGGVKYLMEEMTRLKQVISKV
jgi:acyl-CoA reductase-like NAD-dependent aldehyde dehydrogenase